IAQSVGAANGIHPPAPTRTPTCATMTIAIVAATPASVDRVTVVTQATGVTIALVNTPSAV
ncbi:hypothetical protein K4G96_25950, partial [Mycobacterium tuberculosis]|nr:hypothetical protein [Mycobacterium tuberculosis]